MSNALSRMKPRNALAMGYMGPTGFGAGQEANMRPSAGGLRKSVEIAANSQIPGIADAASGVLAVDDARQGNWGSAGLNALGLLPFVPAMGFVGSTGGRAADALTDAERAARMQDMGMERGWYRGGEAPKGGRRTGPWYTQDPDEATSYARRHGQGADMREYALPAQGYLNAGNSYGPKLAEDVARVLDDPYFDAPGKELAGMLRQYFVTPGERITGGELWQALEARFGNDGASAVLERLGPFSGAKGIAGPNEAYVFRNAPVRDAHAAQFDPARRGADDIYGRADPRLLAGMAGAGLTAAAVHRSRDDE